jgi:hypothetical protein
MCTKSDIALAISVISMLQSAPMQLHMKRLKRLLRYLNGTLCMDITYRKYGIPWQCIRHQGVLRFRLGNGHDHKTIEIKSSGHAQRWSGKLDF